MPGRRGRSNGTSAPKARSYEFWVVSYELDVETQNFELMTQHWSEAT